MMRSVSSITIFANYKTALAFVVELCKVSEVLLCGTALNLELPLVGNLEHGQTTMDRIEHLCKVLRIILGS